MCFLKLFKLGRCLMMVTGEPFPRPFAFLIQGTFVDSVDPSYIDNKHGRFLKIIVKLV